MPVGGSRICPHGEGTGINPPPAGGGLTPVNMPTSGHRRPDARHDVGPMSADVGPISGGRRVCPHVPRTSRGPADLGPTSGRYYWPTSARFASRANVGTIFFHCHPDLTPIIGRLFPELKPRAGRYHSPTLIRHVCRADVGPACSSRQPDMTPLPYSKS